MCSDATLVTGADFLLPPRGQVPVRRNHRDVGFWRGVADVLANDCFSISLSPEGKTEKGKREKRKVREAEERSKRVGKKKKMCDTTII